jgi:hypothetical protein
MVVPLAEFLFVTVGSVALSLVVLSALWPLTRDFRHLVLIGAACAIGIVAWNIALNVTNAMAFNVDSAILGLSVQHVGSGVLAFLATLLALVVADRGKPRSRVFGASAIVGLATIFVDRFG